MELTEKATILSRRISATVSLSSPVSAVPVLENLFARLAVCSTPYRRLRNAWRWLSSLPVSVSPWERRGGGAGIGGCRRPAAMILVDSNVLMYSSGAAHPNKRPAVDFLERVAAGEIEAAIDAEVLQEIIHRYRALRRWGEGQQVYALARKLFPEVLAITGDLMDGAKKLADEDASLSARDAVHAAVVATYRLDGICTFDSDFDRIRSCRRVAL